MPPARPNTEQDYRAFVNHSIRFAALYESRVLVGDVSPVINDVFAWLGLYVQDPVLRFYNPVQDSITAEQLMGQVPAFQLQRELVLPPDEGRRRWRAARAELDALGLPVCFVGCQQGLDDEEALTFWSPRGLDPSAVLHVFRLTVATSFPDTSN